MCNSNQLKQFLLPTRAIICVNLNLNQKLWKIVERTMLRMRFCDCHRENSLNFRKMKSSSRFVIEILTSFCFCCKFNILKYLNDPV